MKKSQVPENIYFDKKILSFPSLIDVGLDEKLSCLGIIQPKVNVGDWVSRDQVLLEMFLTSYTQPNKPKFFWQKDHSFTATYQLESPISGLVIGMKESYIAYHSQYPTGLESLIYGTKKVFPVILIPKDEPSWNDSFFWFYNRIYDFYRQHWQLTQFSHREKGYIRLQELYNYNDFEVPLTEMTKPQIEFEFPNGHKYPNVLTSNIENMRAYNLDLRDKLVHLTKEKP